MLTSKAVKELQWLTENVAHLTWNGIMIKKSASRIAQLIVIILYKENVNVTVQTNSLMDKCVVLWIHSLIK